VPRAGSKTREERQAQGIGDCIDCGYCVQVCPAGIDIRNGLQYQCISCGLCTDACDTIMDSLGFPKGLVRYDSEINIESKTPGKRHIDWMRMRTLGYGGMILVMIAVLIYNISTRSDIQISVQPVRQPLYVELSNGDIRNRYQIHITNKTLEVQKYRIDVRGVPQQALDLGEIGNEVSAHQGKSVMVMANVRLSPAAAEKAKDFEFVITPLSKPDKAITKKVHFYSQHEEHEKHEKTENHEG
jgi:cytochrome c oxidase accessory protein FixG